MRGVDIEALTRGQRKTLLGQTQIALLPRSIEKADDEAAMKRIDELAVYANFIEEALSEDMSLTRHELAFVLVSIAYSVLFGTGE